MRLKPLAVAAVVMISSAALVCPTEGAQRQRWPGGESRSGANGGGGQGGSARGNGGGAVAQRRGGGERQGGAERQGGSERRAEPRVRNGNGNGGERREAGGQARSRSPEGARESGERQPRQSLQQSESSIRQAQPRRVPDARTDIRRGTGERFDQGRVGEQPRVAVPRPVPRSDARRYGNWNGSGYRVYTPRYRTYNRYSGYPYYGYTKPYYYYPYSFGYGPHGRGFFYFDLYYNSYVFYPSSVVRYDNYGSYYGNYGYPTGELRLQVRPRDAQVFIDGAYAGTVDDFDGIFQSLRLEAGDYQVELVLPGYEPLDFDVHIVPGEKVTFKGDLLPEQLPPPLP